MAETLKDQLARHESKRNKPYDDDTGKEFKQGDTLKGKLTIGIGWNLTDVPLPDSIISQMLDISVQKATDDLRKALPWVDKLDWPRRSVLINMCFNLGIGGLLTFKNTLSLIEQGKYLEASTNMLISKWSMQVGHRAVELAEIMKTGVL